MREPNPVVSRCVNKLSGTLRCPNPPSTVQVSEPHYTEPKQIFCKYCGSPDIVKYGVVNKVQQYICKVCHRKFNTNDTVFYKHSSVEQIGTSISSYYDGLSFADIARHLSESGNPVNESTVYRWVMNYAQKAVKMMESYTPKVSTTWIADETVIKFNDKLHWLWDIIDLDTRFLLATYMTYNRGTKEAQIVMELAAKRARIIPKRVVTDKLAAYLDGIELAFGADTKHIRESPFTIDNDNNIIERFQGTIKDRTKVVRGYKTLPTARLILDGFLIHYNFFRPHISLKGKTPAEVAGIKLPFTTWTEFVRWGK